MDLVDFEIKMRERADSLVAYTLSNEEFTRSRYEAKKANPSIFMSVGLTVDSALRFGMWMAPHELVGDEYFETSVYDDVMNKILTEVRHRLRLAIYKDLS